MSKNESTQQERAEKLVSLLNDQQADEASRDDAAMDLSELQNAIVHFVKSSKRCSLNLANAVRNLELST